MREYAPVHISECTSTQYQAALVRRTAPGTGVPDRPGLWIAVADCLGAAVRWTAGNPPSTTWSFPLRWYGTDPPPDGLALGTLARIVGLMRPFWRRVAVAFLLGVTMLAITLVIPLVTKTIIDEGLTKRVPGVLGREIALLMVLAVVRWVVSGLRRNLSGRVGTDVEYHLRNRLARHLLTLEAAYHDRVPTGQLLARATSDVRSLRYFISWGLVFMVLNLLTFAIAAVQMWLLSPRLCLVVLALAPPLVYGALRFNRRLHRVYWQVQQEIGELTTVVEEATAGVRVVKAFGRENEQTRRLETEASSILDQNLEAARLRAFYTPLLAILPQLSLAAIIWYGGRLAIDGQITLGTLVAFNSYLLLLAWPLQGLGMLFGFAQRAAASGERVFEVLDQPPAIADHPDAVDLPATAPRGGPGDRRGGPPVNRGGPGDRRGGPPVNRGGPGDCRGGPPEGRASRRPRPASRRRAGRAGRRRPA